MPSEQIKALGEDIKASLEDDIIDQFRLYDIIDYLNRLIDSDTKDYSDAEVISEYKELLHQLHLCVLFTFSLIDGESISDFLASYPEFETNFSVARDIIKIQAKVSVDQDVVLYLNPLDAFYQQQIVTRYLSHKYVAQDIKEIFEISNEGMLFAPEFEVLNDMLGNANKFIATLKILIGKIDTHIFINDIEVTDKTLRSDYVAFRFYNYYVYDHDIKPHINLEYFETTVKDRINVKDADLNQIMTEVFSELRLGLLFVYRLLERKYPAYYATLEIAQKIPEHWFALLKDPTDENYLTQREIIDCYYEPIFIERKYNEIAQWIENGEIAKAEEEIVLTYHDLKCQVDCVNYILKTLAEKQPIYKDDEVQIAETERVLSTGKILGIHGCSADILAVMAATPIHHQKKPGKDIYDEQVKRCKQKLDEFVQKKDEFYRYFNAIKKKVSAATPLAKLLKGNADISTKFNAEVVNSINNFGTKYRFFETAVFNESNQDLLIQYEAELDKLPAKLGPFIDRIVKISETLTEKKPPVQATTPNSGSRRNGKKTRGKESLDNTTLRRAVSADSVIQETKSEVSPPVKSKKLRREQRRTSLMSLPTPAFTVHLNVYLPENEEVEEVNEKALASLAEVIEPVKVEPVLTKRQKRAIKKQQQLEQEQQLEREQRNKIFSTPVNITIPDEVLSMNIPLVTLDPTEFNNNAQVLPVITACMPVDEQEKLLNERNKFLAVLNDDVVLPLPASNDDVVLPLPASKDKEVTTQPQKNIGSHITLFKPYNFNSVAHFFEPQVNATEPDAFTLFACKL